MPKNFAQAMLDASKIANDFYRRLGSVHTTATPADAAIAFTLLAKKFDEELHYDPKNPRAIRDLMIVMLGGSPPGQVMLGAMLGESSPVPEEDKLEN